MTRQEYDGICRAAYGGEDIIVENKGLHERGQVFNCKLDTFHVRVGNEIRQWGRKVCERDGEEKT
jgi:hypothetical protein